MASVSTEWSNLVEVTQHMVSDSLGIVSSKDYLEVLQKARQGHAVRMVPMMRTLGIEIWLRNLSNYRILASADKDMRNSAKGLAPTFVSAEKN